MQPVLKNQAKCSRTINNSASHPARRAKKAGEILIKTKYQES